MAPRLNSAKSAQVAYAKSAAMIEFNDESKAEKASEAYGHCIDYARNMPKGCNKDFTHEQFVARLDNHVRKQMGPTGFIGITLGWLILSMLSGVISWAVQKFMQNNFDKT